MADAKTVDAQFTIGAQNHLAIDQDGAMVHADEKRQSIILEMEHDYEGKPTAEEFHTLRRVAGKIPYTAYGLCFAEFCERGSYYSSIGVISNFVNRKLPVGGNGYGAPPKGTQQTAGALGLGTVKATAVSQSFKMLVYCLPVIFGYIADTYTGRFRLICYGVAVFGVAHALMIASGAPSLLASGHAVAPYLISLYVLSIGAAMFKPCVSPVLLDQIEETKPTIKTLDDGERVIVDPESTTERVVLWFYLLINVGGFLGVPSSYLAKDVGWMVTFTLPMAIYVPLPFVLWYLHKKLILYPPGGSDLFNCFKVLGICLKKNFSRFGRHGFWEAAKPSVLAASGASTTVPWNDQFVEDVRRTFQATGMFCFFPIQYINDNGLGIAADALSTMLITNGQPNDLISNFNSLSIIIMAPVLNYGLYPYLRKHHIHFGPVARITTGLLMSAIGAVGYTVLNYYAYKIGPCGHYGSSSTCVDADGISLVAPISIWWMAIPYALGGISELFVNVPAYGLAYSRAPKNMRSLVTALNLFSTGIAYALGLAFAGLIKDPYLTWDLGAPAIIGFVATGVFYYLFRHIDKEEYVLSTNDDYHVQHHSATGSSVGQDERPVDKETKV
ncbi:peptide transporter [Mollisia scopiformis]|uniref:Peptide transporter n=1 Tax=Mollisia scopiformis TaxID=149040 RepID=A0A132BAZ2_MOLSC|nr:peptide transporter [Mollisia scopiformis]KUJ09169.1 peptide transporter [Mollisia scopiformis]